MYSLYVHISPSGKRYFGITQNSVKRRWGSNGISYKNNKHFWSAIQKYGWENFQHIVLADNLSKEWACQLEVDCIWKYNTTNPDYGYNNAIGGEINSGFHYNLDEQTRQKISNAIKEWHSQPEIKKQFEHINLGNKASEETRKKLSEAHKGLTSGMKGKKHTLESKQKMSNSQKGKIISDEQRKRISEANKNKIVSDETKEKLRQSALGRKFTEEHKRKLSEAHKNKPSNNKGKKMTQEQKDKIRNSLKEYWKYRRKELR